MTFCGPLYGIVAAYRERYRAALYRELFARWDAMPVLARGEGVTAFLTPRYSQILEDIRQNGPPVFLWHLHPFCRVCPLVPGQEGIKALLDAAEVLFAAMDRSAHWTVQAHIASGERGQGLTGALTERLQKAGFTVSPKEAEAALSLTGFSGLGFLGVSRLSDNVSRRCGGVLFYRKGEDFVSRAAFKLEEAVEAFGIDLSQVRRAVDLGAAPGGWTQFLAARGVRVDAVDPARLDPRVQENPFVRYHPVSAQEFAAEGCPQKYGLIVNDMKMDALKSVEIVLKLLPRLRPGGQVLVTLKLPKKGFLKKAEAAQRRMETRFRLVRLRHLYYDRSELTLYAKDPK